MRTLSSNEINSITGAGYSEDIITTAASIYVGSAIGSAASAISATAFSTGLSAIAPLGTIVTPLMYFAAPVLVFEAVYPGVIAEKIESYFN